MYEKLLERRSVRKYKPEQISEELLDAVLKAGLYAPTAKNNQKPVMVAVRDKQTRDLLSKLNAEIWGIESDPFYGAPVVLIVLAEKKYPTYLYDGSLVMGNLMLAAHAHGIGSCWIHRAKEEFELPEGKAILAELGIEGEFEGIGHCILGYPEGDLPVMKERKKHYVYWIE